MNDFITTLKPWWGKLSGLIMGYLYAGPYGAMFGIIIGNLIDKIIFNHLYSPQWHHYRSASREVQNLFYPTLFQTMGHLAKTDGYVSEADINIARKVMGEMRLHGYRKRMAMKYFNEGKEQPFDLHRSLNLIHRLCAHHPGLLKLFASTLHRTARVDNLNIHKQQKLNIIFSRLGFVPVYRSSRYHGQKHGHSSESSYQSESFTPLDDYSIIGVKPNASIQEIKRAYRRKISKIHPDKLIARGASKKELEEATNKTQLLQAAYDRVKSVRGF